MHQVWHALRQRSSFHNLSNTTQCKGQHIHRLCYIAVCLSSKDRNGEVMQAVVSQFGKCLFYDYEEDGEISKLWCVWGALCCEVWLWYWKHVLYAEGAL